MTAALAFAALVLALADAFAAAARGQGTCAAVMVLTGGLGAWVLAGEAG